VSAAGRRWWPVAAVMFCIGWGGNQFTPLLSVYREVAGYTQVDVDVLLGAYVAGLVPGLLLAAALSDHYGRRPLLVAGAVCSAAGSGVLALGPAGGFGALTAGRALTGVAVGIAMAVGTAWVTELSRPPHDPAARPGAGARRAAIALSLGFGAGPGAAGVLAQWGPDPLVVPFAVQVFLVAIALAVLLARGTETRTDRGGARLRLRVPAAAHRRFRWVVAPMAPWIFGSAGIAYAIVPQVVGARLGRWSLLYATALTVATLGTGVAVQPLARRLDSRSTARAVLVSMTLMSAGVALAALTAALRSPWLGVPAALLLGAAYGIAVISGLLELQRIATPDDLAGLTGVYYALAYLGFLLPAALAGLSRWAGYPELLTALALAAVACTAVIASASTRHLPPRPDTELADPGAVPGAEPAGPAGLVAAEPGR
jgi:predicted MFS family arabinose efflux permease